MDSGVSGVLEDGGGREEGVRVYVNMSKSVLGGQGGGSKGL